MQILRPRQESKCRALLPFPFPSSLFPISGIRFETPVKHMSAPRGGRFLCMPTFRSNIAARLPASKLSCLGSPHQRIIYERGRSHENQPRRAKSSSEKTGAGNRSYDMSQSQQMVMTRYKSPILGRWTVNFFLICVTYRRHGKCYSISNCVKASNALSAHYLSIYTPISAVVSGSMSKFSYANTITSFSFPKKKKKNSVVFSLKVQ